MAVDKLTIKKGSIIDATETYICHQCNCCTQKASGVASVIFARFPEANVYSTRTDFDTPGTVKIRQSGEKYIVNMFAQFKPGNIKSEHQARVRWFEKCLNDMTDILSFGSTYAMPYGIGCGLAGGDMQTYMTILEKWANQPRVGHLTLYRID